MKFAWFCFSLLFLITLGCNEKDSFPEENLGTGDFVSSISVSKQDLKKASDEENNLVEIPGETETLSGYNNFNEGNLLYISQLGTEKEPNFLNSPSSNFYVYEYQENREATWENEYNFIPFNNAAIKWSLIRDFGSVGNAFSLYALSFPGSTSTDFDLSNLDFKVLSNQTGSDEDPYEPINFYNSDILGAYHATSALFTRLRFKLFHLMVHLKITIYAPVYENPTDFNDKNNGLYSGFKEDAMVAGYLLNAQNQYSINWRANRSSDIDPPLTVGNGDKTNIKMYLYKPVNEEINLEEVNQYFPDSTIPNDKVRAYNFSVLFPAQTFNQNENLLCFVLRGVENNYKYYYFSANQIEKGTYALNQGTIQHLYLYIPRSTNKTVLIGATILNWSNSYSDMTVNQEKDNSSSDESLED